jgi:hypothetical protein
VTSKTPFCFAGEKSTKATKVWFRPDQLFHPVSMDMAQNDWKKIDLKEMHSSLSVGGLVIRSRTRHPLADTPSVGGHVIR